MSSPTGTYGGVKMLLIMKEKARKALKVRLHFLLCPLMNGQRALLYSERYYKDMNNQMLTVYVVCCIYHKPHSVDESSSDSDSDSSDSSDSSSSMDSDEESIRQTNRRNADLANRNLSSNGRPSQQAPEEPNNHPSNITRNKGKRRKPSPNAYEKVPRANRKHVETFKR